MLRTIWAQFGHSRLGEPKTLGEDQVKRFFVDKAFMSTKGFLPTEGTFESSVGLFRIKQIVVKQSGKVILLVDHSKFRQRAFVRCSTFHRLTRL